MSRSDSQNTQVFKAFCDENRLQILALLRGGEKCACDLLETLHIGQSTLSHHMRILCDSGVVTSRKNGKWAHYRIDTEGRARAAGAAHGLCRRANARPWRDRKRRADRVKEGLYDAFVFA